MGIKRFRIKKIAIFATAITTKSRVQEKLIVRYCQNIRVYKIPFKNLAGLIERGETSKATYAVVSTWSKYKNLGIDTIVLGCTHYTLIKPEIQKIVGKQVKIIDSNQAVARQVKRILDI